MRQTPINTESAPPKIHCNKIGHENEFISHVCLRADCEEQRAHCRKCNLIQHRQCAEEICFMDEITNQIKSIDLVHIKIVNLIEVAMQKFQHILTELNSLRQFIQHYSEVPNLSNLNIVAGILNYYSQQNIEKLLQGQDQLDNLISSHYMPQSLQIAKNKIKNLYQNQFTIEMSSNVNSKSNNTTIINQGSNSKTKIDSHPNFNPNPSLPTNISSISINQQNSDNDNNNNNNNNNNKSNTNTTNSNTNTTNSNNNQNNNINTNNSNLIDEGSAQQYHMKAQYYRKNQKHAESLEYFDMAILLNPNNPSYWNNKGTALNSLDRDLESLEYFDKALEIVNSKPQIDRESKFAYLRNKASALIKLDQFENSIKTINEGLALDPLNKHFIKLKYTSLLHFQRFDEALEFVNELIQLNSNNYKPHQMKVAGILIKFQKFQEAMDCFCLANSIKPKKGTYFLLGKLLEQLCRFDEAESCYQSALKLDQNYYQARQQLQIVQQYKEFK